MPGTDTRALIEERIQALIDGGMTPEEVRAKSEEILLEGLTALGGDEEEEIPAEEMPPDEDETPVGPVMNPLDAILASKRKQPAPPVMAKKPAPKEMKR